MLSCSNTVNFWGWESSCDSVTCNPLTIMLISQNNKQTNKQYSLTIIPETMFYQCQPVPMCPHLGIVRPLPRFSKVWPRHLQNASSSIFFTSRISELQIVLAFFFRRISWTWSHPGAIYWVNALKSSWGIDVWWASLCMYVHHVSIHIKNRAWSPSLPFLPFRHVFYISKSKMAAKKKSVQGVGGAAAGGGIWGSPYKKMGVKK